MLLHSDASTKESMPGGAAGRVHFLIRKLPRWGVPLEGGSWHGSEIAHVFDNSERISSRDKVAATENQLKVSELMNKAWAEFAKDPEKGLSKLGWPVYNEKGSSNPHSDEFQLLFSPLLPPTENTLILLAENNGPSATFAMGRTFDAQCNRLTNNLPIAGS
jgi:hypothetical protein